MDRHLATTQDQPPSVVIHADTAEGSWFESLTPSHAILPCVFNNLQRRVIFSIELSRLQRSVGMYNGLLNRCVLDEPVSGRSCQATMPPARCASVGVWGNCASVTPFAECESVCLVTVAADPTSSAGSVAALPLGRSDRR